MKKDYNKVVTSDMPMDSSFTPEVKETPKTTATKPKINAIGKKTQGKSTTSSRTQSKTGTSKKPTTKKETETHKESSTKEKTKSLRTKLKSSSVEMSDLEKLNEENIRVHSFRSRRNRVIIIILSVLLAISVVSISVFAVVNRLKTNCNMIIHGNVGAVYIVDDLQINEFRTPSSLQGNSILRLDIKVKISSTGLYNVRFIPECYQKGELMQNVLIYEPNFELFKEMPDGSYCSKEPIQGNQTITLCGGVILDYDYRYTLNADNFRMDFHTYFEKV